MAVLKNGYVSVDGNDISALVRDVKINESKVEVESTGLTQTGAMDYEHGLYSGSITITAKSKFGAEGLSVILRPLLLDETSFEFLANPFPLPTSIDNPQYQATCKLFTNDPISAAIGALMTTGITLRVVDGVIEEVYT